MSRSGWSAWCFWNPPAMKFLKTNAFVHTIAVVRALLETGATVPNTAQSISQGSGDGFSSSLSQPKHWLPGFSTYPSLVKHRILQAGRPCCRSANLSSGCHCSLRRFSRWSPSGDEDVMPARSGVLQSRNEDYRKGKASHAGTCLERCQSWCNEDKPQR